MRSEAERHGLWAPSVAAECAAFVLGVTGLLTIASSRYAVTAKPDPLLIKQMLFLVIGIVLMFAAAAVPFRFYRKNALLLGGLGVLSLLLLPLVGSSVHGMRGWIMYGELSLQPSELMKPAFVLVLSVIMAQREIPEWRRFGLAVLWTLALVVPVAWQPDFGTAVIYFGTFMLLYFTIGGKLRYLAFPMLAGAAAAAVFIQLHPYAWRRICAFIDPESDPLGSGWHARQFELAIARGHLFGAKLGGALWSNNYLPFSYNDSAFATLMETLGMAGGVMIGAMLTLLAVSLLRLGATENLRPANRMFILGVMLLLVFQSIVHISVNLCLLPTTGLTMPFVSYGGSSLAGCFVLLGMALSAGKETHNHKEDGEK